MPKGKGLSYKSHLLSKATVESDGSVRIAGYANRAIVDDIGDLMIPSGAGFKRFEKNPMMFFNHNRSYPVGKWEKWEPKEDGLWVEGVISNSPNPDIQFVRDLVKEGILQTLSIGYDENEAEKGEGNSRRITKWDLHEVSIVTIPMNMESTFQVMKGLDEAMKGKDFTRARSLVEGLKTRGVNGRTKADEGQGADGNDGNGSGEGDTSKAEVPTAEMSQEELHAAQQARMNRYGIEILEATSLTFPEGMPTELEKYGDPVNLAYPIHDVEHANNARVRFKQNYETYKEQKSRNTVHERIVKAQMELGAKPSFDAEDELDMALPESIRSELEASKAATDFQTCVSDKIPKLIEEGKPQDQAIAIAISMCREEGKCRLFPSDEQWKSFVLQAEEALKKKQATMIPGTTEPVANEPHMAENELIGRMDQVIGLLGQLVTKVDALAASLANGQGANVPSQWSAGVPSIDANAGSAGAGTIGDGDAGKGKENVLLAKAASILETVDRTLKELNL
jgi:HK97 family phage prohead protease